MSFIDFAGFFKKDFIAGLDIGSSTVKLALFEKRENTLFLKKVDIKEIEKAVDDPARDQEIAGIINGLFSQVDKDKTHVVATVNCRHTAINCVTVPYMPRQELGSWLNLGVKNYFPFPVVDPLPDYQVIGEASKDGARHYEALIAVSPRKTIDKYVSLLSQAGIYPVSIQPVAVALETLAVEAFVKEGSNLCFIDIGAMHTELAILKGKKLIFSRKIPVSGQDFTIAMTGALVSDRGRVELSFEEAEKIKREVGIPLESQVKSINEKLSTAQILSMLRSPLSQLVSEIARCFDYYNEESHGERIDSLVLSGGGSCLKGLARFISDELGVEAKVADPLFNLKTAQGLSVSSELACQAAIAIGAALSRGSGINLIPLELKERTKRAFKRTTFDTAVTVFILSLVLLYVGMKIQLGNYKKKINVAKLELSSLRPEYEQARVFAKLADEPFWLDLFKELSNLVPNNIHLTSVAMNKKQITIVGIVPASRWQNNVSDFVIALENGLFKNVKLVKSAEAGNGVSVVFELNCWVD